METKWVIYTNNICNFEVYEVEYDDIVIRLYLICYDFNL